MKQLPKISIVIPSYNKVDFIKDTLNSIISQKYPNLEVIIQDGASTDGTLDIIKEFANKYPKVISWVSKKDKGQVQAINKGLKKTSGEIITYINADDVYEKGALHKVGKHFLKHPKTLWLAGKGRVIDKKGREISRWVSRYKSFLLKQNKYLFLLMVNYFFQPSVFLSKIAYKKHGPFIGIKGSVLEYGLWLKLGKIKMPEVLDTYISSFRLTMDTISATQFRDVLSQDYKLVRQHTKNPILLGLHYLNNIGRVVVVNLLKKR